MMAKRRLGGADVGKDLIIGSDLTYQRLGANPAEMQSIESRKLNREDLCVLFRVPPPMIGIYEDATLSNIEEAHKIFWRTRVIRSEEHTSELQSRGHLVCRLLLEK